MLTKPLGTQKLLVFATLLAAFSCRPRQTAAIKEAAPVQNPGHAEDASVGFRNIFLGSIAHPEAPNSWPFYLYLPTPDLMTAPASNSADDFFSALRVRYQSKNSTIVFGQSAAIAASPMPTTDIDQKLLREPITIVMFPGIFAEFIDILAMNEILTKQDSSFAIETAQKLAAIEQSPSGRDSMFDLKQNTEVDVPLSAVVAAASMDDSHGQALVRLVLLKTPFMSLESLGTTSKKSAIMLRRLNKFLAAIGTPKNMVFMGYSRGTPLALDVVSQASDQPWFKSLRGVVSLAGVTYGTESADDAQKEGTPTFKYMQAFQMLLTDLKETDNLGTLEKPVQIAKNAATWLRFLNDMRKASPGVSFSELFAENRSVDPSPTLQSLTKVYESLGLDRPIHNYSENIRKFKVFIREIIDGANSLTTKSRLAWWSQHTIPTDGIVYYSLVASMPDPDEDPTAKSLLSNQYTYDSKSPDDLFLLSAQRGLHDSSGQALNDSQVVIYKSRFWPELAPLLNPHQQPFTSKFLGILGTHHWGLALTVVNKNRNGTTNPFPRAALVKAIAAQVAMDVTNQDHH